MSELDDRDPCKTGPRTTRTERDLLAMLNSASYDYCRAVERAEKAESRVKELEADLAACREFQDIAEASVKELKRALSAYTRSDAIRFARAEKAEARVKELEAALTLANIDALAELGKAGDAEASAERYKAALKGLVDGKASGAFAVDVETDCDDLVEHELRCQNASMLWRVARKALGEDA